MKFSSLFKLICLELNILIMAGFMMLLISSGLVAAHAWRGPTFNRGVRNRNRVINQNSFNQQDVVWTRAQDSWIVALTCQMGWYQLIIRLFGLWWASGAGAGAWAPYLWVKVNSEQNNVTRSLALARLVLVTHETARTIRPPPTLFVITNKIRPRSFCIIVKTSKKYYFCTPGSQLFRLSITG